MAELALSSLVERGIAQRIEGDPSVCVRGVKHDSRRCEPGDLFVAMAGQKEDGARFVADAIARGAVAVLAQEPVTCSVPRVFVADALIALARVSALLYGEGSRELAVVGITGTNGKTTTAYLLEAILSGAGLRPAVIGTVSFRGPFGVLPATHTTPMADDMMRLCRLAADSGATHLVAEVSSHGLHMHRVDGLRFRVAGFTNLTQDHLDYHGDMVSYEAAKRRLFTDLAPEHSVINVDDEVGRRFASVATGKLWRCTSRGELDGRDAEIVARSFTSDRHGLRASVRTPAGDVELQSPLIGEHNLENLLIALGCGLALGLPLADIARALESARGAPGRLERIAHPEDVLVFVDYAHTPDALARVLSTLRKTTSGRLIVTFGCGGDRDPSKRPIMGRHAAELADLVVLTSDNPRSEDPRRILSQIERGVVERGLVRTSPEALAAQERGYTVVEDRRAAIGLALSAARPGDTVLVAGKGHEKVQILGSEQVPFDDCVEAEAAIARLEGVR